PPNKRPWIASPLCGFRIASAIPPPVADPPSTIRTPALVAHPDPAARRQNASHSPRRSLPHPDGPPPIPHPPRTAAVAIPCVPCGSSFRCVNAQMWTPSASPWHTPFCLEFARLGSVGDYYTISLAGSSLAFSGQLATKQ